MATPRFKTVPTDWQHPFGPYRQAPPEYGGEWENNLKDWKGVKLPPWLTPAQLNFANEIYKAWGMGAAIVYEGVYGYSVRWPETGHYEFEGEARSAILTSVHWKVAEFQDFLRNKGLPVPKPHPFLPPAPK